MKPHSNIKPLYEDLHSRPFPVLGQAVKISHLAIKSKQAQHELDQLHQLFEQLEQKQKTDKTDCFYLEFDNFSFRWERHTEFSTYTVIAAIQDEALFNTTAWDLLPLNWRQDLDGDLISAINVEMRTAETVQPNTEKLHPAFEDHSLIGSYIGNQHTSLWTAFRLHSDGMGRLLVCYKDINPCQQGRLLRTILELETYRCMAMLAMPTAVEILPQVREMEDRLALVIEALPQQQSMSEEQAALKELSQIASINERLISDSSYRFAAASAYHELVDARLLELREAEIPGLLSVSEFIHRRLKPAQKTCNSAKQRMADLSLRVERASELLRTKINMDVQIQNQELLHALNERSRLSLFLQRSVEGLSVVVISYYILAMLKPLLNTGTEIQQGLQWSSNTFISLLTPIILISVWLGMKSLKKKVDNALKNIEE